MRKTTLSNPNTSINSIQIITEADPLVVYGGNAGETLFAKADGTYSHHSRTYAGGGDDLVIGSASYDDLYGGSGNDKIYGGGGDDRLYGGSGNDKLHGGNGFDWLEGGEGHDSLTSGAGMAHLEGGAGDDTLVGSTDDISVLFGDEGNDTLILNAMESSLGQNFLVGGTGWDVAVLDEVMAGTEVTLSQGYGNLLKLNWTDVNGEVHHDSVTEVEQFQINGTYYVVEQLFV